MMNEGKIILDIGEEEKKNLTGEDLLHEFEVKTCYFGHIHGAYYAKRTQEFEGIDFTLCAADYLNFAPMPVYPD